MPETQAPPDPLAIVGQRIGHIQDELAFRVEQQVKALEALATAESERHGRDASNYVLAMPWLCEEALRMVVELRDELDQLFNGIPSQVEARPPAAPRKARGRPRPTAAGAPA